MKNSTPLILLSFVIIISCSSKIINNNSQYFVGRIHYKNSYIIKTDKIDSAKLNTFFGHTADLSFKEGNFCEKYDGGIMLEQTFNKADNKTYVKKKLDSDTLYWFDCGTPAQPMLRFEINKHKEKILGIDCDELITCYNNKTVTFYYNSDTLKINPNWYKNFTHSNKNSNEAKMKAVYLKYKIEYADFIATVTATSIIPRKINKQ